MTLNNQHQPIQNQVTLRGTIAGLLIGTLILLSNFQFGLQTGWVSMMSLPAALLGFSIFKLIDTHFGLTMPFTPQENVFVQSVAVAVATGPLAYGFIGIIPAIEKFLTPEESGLVNEIRLELVAKISSFNPFNHWWKLLIWSAGLAFFGVFFAIPLREEFIIKEKLKFPSGSATATLISVFHNYPLCLIGKTQEETDVVLEDPNETIETIRVNDNDDLNDLSTSSFNEPLLPMISNVESYSRDITILLCTSAISSLYTVTSYFIPQIRIIPIFGSYLSNEYLINFTPSPAYIGQGIIMGFDTTFGMFVGMFIGWFILSPFVKFIGWAPGETSDWKEGSEGWIMWISLSIMISDSIVSLGVISYKSIKTLIQRADIVKNEGELLTNNGEDSHSYSSTENEISFSNESLPAHSIPRSQKNSLLSFFRCDKIAQNEEYDEAMNPLIPSLGLLLCCPILIISMKYLFGSIIPAWLLLVTIPMSLVLSLVGVKSLGETDLNPVSGIGKLSQLLTALLLPSSTPGAVLINLIVGAVSEATSQQAGDLMQDLKTGYLLNGSPKAQFLGQIFGSIWGVLVAAPMYKWYNKVYEIPGPVFKIPTAVIWIDCARLVNGHELPPNVGIFVILFGVVFFILSVIKTTKIWKYSDYIPSGVAIGIGIYNTPSFTLARFLGGIISYFWVRKLKAIYTNNAKNIENGKVSLIIFSSGLVLGEGLFSVFNMVLASLDVAHL